jgi:ElaB/YqjD/DUF883 family membrane-anchored ribosome-binding protein
LEKSDVAIQLDFGVAAPLRKFISTVKFALMKTNDVTEKIQDKIQDFQQRASETARNAYKATDEYVHENAWTSVALAAVAGCVIGFFLGRGRD